MLNEQYSSNSIPLPYELEGYLEVIYGPKARNKTFLCCFARKYDPFINVQRIIELTKFNITPDNNTIQILFSRAVFSYCQLIMECRVHHGNPTWENMHTRLSPIEYSETSSIDVIISNFE